MNSYSKIFVYLFVLLVSIKQYAQHHSKIAVSVNMDRKILDIQQDIIYYNQSNDSLTYIVLNDWNNAFSDRNSPLGKRFSDEFYTRFHLAKDENRGETLDLCIEDTDKIPLLWERTSKNPDYCVVFLNKKLAPNQKILLHLSYSSKTPSDQFTKYGFSDANSMNLKNWFLTPARYENQQFIKYSNENLDDIANAVSDFNVELKIKKIYDLTTDLTINKSSETRDEVIYNLVGTRKTDFSLIIEQKSTFEHFKIDNLEVITDIKASKLNDSIREMIIKQIVNFTTQQIGKYPAEKIIISQTDYDRNPFYGLNQLPKFMSLFSEDFLFEIKFLKTYLNTVLKNSLQLDSRKDNWIYDGIQVFSMINYINTYHPNSKMMGKASKFLLLRGYQLAKVNFNEQYGYYHMFMARKNLDQPLNASKNTLLKFNVQIANKYRAGLSFKYLDNYLGNDLVSNSIRDFYLLNSEKQTNRNDFETILKNNANKNIDWFFKFIIDSREIIDYKFNDVSKTKDSVTFTVKNKSMPLVPVPVFGIKDKQIVFNKWVETNEIDSAITLDRRKVDKIAINYNNEVPEFNLRNNYKSLQLFSLNRPLKLIFFEDLENPRYSQLFYTPTLFYNLYDGFSPGISFYNTSLLDKPFSFALNPMYSINTKSIVGSYGLTINQYLRTGRLYNIKYSLSGSYFHYAPDAAYLKLYPSLSMYLRQPNYRDNRKQVFFLKYNIINKEPSAKVIDSTDNYSILNIKYLNIRTEVTSHVKFLADIQFSDYFGKISSDIEYRKFFNDNRFFNIRLFGGTFLYNTNNTQNYNFGISRPNDYLFDFNVYARSETTGILSQQYFLSQGGFKSFLTTSNSNKWLLTSNASYTIWNWIDVYGDFGVVKSKGQNDIFLYDSGIRLNLVTDYFELFFPVYSSNGLEIKEKQYNEKIRFIFIFNPKSLVNLFTRKWF